MKFSELPDPGLGSLHVGHDSVYVQKPPPKHVGVLMPNSIGGLDVRLLGLGTLQTELPIHMKLYLANDAPKGGPDIGCSRPVRCPWTMHDFRVLEVQVQEWGARSLEDWYDYRREEGACRRLV